MLCCSRGALGLWAPFSWRARVACCVCGAPGYVVLAFWRVRVVCCVPGAACVVCAVLVWLWVVCVLMVWCAWWFIWVFLLLVSYHPVCIFRRAEE